MNKKGEGTGLRTVFLIFLVIVFGTSSYMYIKNMSYAPYTLDENNCQVYNEICTCFGTLKVLESYPEQYECSGYAWCRAHEQTVCE